MTKCIMVPNHRPPFNLRRFYANPDMVAAELEQGVDEQTVYQYVINRNIAVGEIPPGTSCHVIEEDDQPGCQPGGCPTDETDHEWFFDCWEWKADKVVVNLPKARVVHMARIRKVRDAELARLDVPFMQALEAGNTAEQQRVAAQKQVLRDIPQTFDLTTAATPKELKSRWPPELQ